MFIEYKNTYTDLYILFWIIGMIFLFNLQLNLIKMSKSSQHQTPLPPKPFNKLDLLNDVVAFLSVLGGFQFLSFTLHYNVFEGLFGLTFNHINDITLIYIVYAVLIILLKIAALTIKLIKKEEVELAVEINQAASKSLYHVFIIVTFYVITAAYGRPIDLAVLCHVTAWLFAAQINLIFCSLLRKVAIFQSVQLFGYTIETILVIGQLLRWLDIDFFDFL